MTVSADCQVVAVARDIARARGSNVIERCDVRRAEQQTGHTLAVKR